MSQPTQAEIIRRWRADPEFFGRTILRRKRYTPDQRMVMAAVAANRRVTVRSGHGTGKTGCAADLALWWLITRHPSKVIITAPTKHQVEDLLWSEIRASYSRAGENLQGITIPGKEPQLHISSEHYLRGLAVRDPVAFQGFHSPHLLVIVDEASGVHPLVYEQIEGALSSAGSSILLIGNPGPPMGPFFDSHAGAKSVLWTGRRLSCLYHPNVVTGRDLYPGMVTRHWIEEKRIDWGEASPIYRARVLGEFPQQADNSLIHLDWAENAMTPGLEVDDAYEQPILACDVARFGDNETVITEFVGHRQVWMDVRVGQDLTTTAGRIEARMRDRDYSPTVPVVIDDDGVGGGLTDIMGRIHKRNVIPFRGGAEAKDPTRFPNARSEAWWFLARSLEKGGLALLPDDRLKGQLTSVLYSFDADGRIVLEKKEAMEKRGLPSPDRGDAVAMGWWFNAPGPPAEAKKVKTRPDRVHWRQAFQELSGIR